jgi:hypothetical protein
MLLATTSHRLSNTFEVYAVDNCDAISTCTNVPGTGTGNTQTNYCTDFSDCRNEITGNDNIQKNECNSVPSPGCFNVATGDGNKQSNNCDTVTTGAIFPPGFSCNMPLVTLRTFPSFSRTNMSVVFKKTIVAGEVRPLATMSTLSCGSLIRGWANVFWISAPCNMDIIAINTRLFSKLDFCNEVQ